MESKKTYVKPQVVTRTVQLGVFGDYDGTTGGGNEPHPVKVVPFYEYTIE